MNQIVISLLGGKRNLKRASAYAAGKPTASAKAVDNIEMTLLLYTAIWASGKDNWNVQFPNVGLKLTHGIPTPVTVKVSLGILKLLEIDHHKGKKKINVVANAITV